VAVRALSPAKDDRVRARIQAFIFAWWWLMPLPASPHPLVLAATEYPPYYSEAMAHGGPVTEITVDALHKAGLEVEVRFMPWARALRLGELGEVDGLIGVWRSPEREQKFIYSHPVISNRVALCKRASSREPSRFEGYDRLTPYTVGTVRGYADPPGLAAAGIRSEPSTDDLQNLRKLLAGRVDLVLIDTRVGQYLMQEQLPAALKEVQCLEPAVQEPEQYLVITRHRPDAASLIQRFDAQLQHMRADGEYRAAVSRWGLDAPVFNAPR
jgi:polar amino acid transport system substrate-binding protein